ncbi:MAG: hypothetical protein KIH67_002980 [Candidatus Moranbacteria bacterium]|nr:hypothetical protein [Candidatus Moranbacteria bacterium]
MMSFLKKSSLFLVLVFSFGYTTPASASRPEVSPASLDFGIVQVGDSKTMSVTLRNAPNAFSPDSTITGAVAFGGGSGGPFACVSGCNLNLSVGQSQVIVLSFSPTWDSAESKTVFLGGITIGISGQGMKAPSCGPAAKNYFSFQSSYSSTACTGGYQDWYRGRYGSNYQPAPWTFPNYGTSSGWTCPNVNGSGGPSCTATRNNYPTGSVSGGSCTIPRFQSSCTVNVSWSSAGAEQGQVYLMQISPSTRYLTEGLSGSYALGLRGESDGQVSAFDVVTADFQTPRTIGRQMRNSSGSGYNSARVSSRCESGTVWVGSSCDVPAPAGPPAPVVDLKINGSDGPVSVFYGSSFTLSWGNVANATNCTGASTAQTSWIGAKAVSGGSDTGMRALASGSYTITCNGPGGSSFDTVNLNVLPIPAPVVDLKINGSDGPIEVTNGAIMNISWPAVSNAVSCTGTSGTNWSGPGKSILGGNDSIVASGASIYTLTCVNLQGVEGSDLVSVTIRPALKMCQDACDSGIEPPSSFSMNRGDTKNLVACYNDAADCTSNIGDLTDDPACTWAEGGNSAVSLSGGAPNILSGDNLGTESIQVSCNSQVIRKDVTVTCTDSGACARDNQFKNLCQKDIFTVTDNCGQTQTCHGEKSCNYNWIEVAP